MNYIKPVIINHVKVYAYDEDHFVNKQYIKKLGIMWFKKHIMRHHFTCNLFFFHLVRFFSFKTLSLISKTNVYIYDLLLFEDELLIEHKLVLLTMRK